MNSSSSFLSLRVLSLTFSFNFKFYSDSTQRKVTKLHSLCWVFTPNPAIWNRYDTIPSNWRLLRIHFIFQYIFSHFSFWCLPDVKILITSLISRDYSINFDDMKGNLWWHENVEPLAFQSCLAGSMLLSFNKNIIFFIEWLDTLPCPILFEGLMLWKYCSGRVTAHFFAVIVYDYSMESSQ